MKIRLVLSMLFFTLLLPTTTFSQSGRSPISPANASQVVELRRIGRGTISKVEWSPDGSTLAVAGSVGVWLYPADELGQPPRLLEGHTERILDLAFSPDGILLATGSADGTARIWDVAQGTTQQILNPQSEEMEGVHTVAFSPDGKTLATGSSYRTVNFWDTATGTAQPSLDDFCGLYPYSLAYSPDGTQLACAGNADRSDFRSGEVAIWNFATGTAATIPASSVYDVQFSPDEKYIAFSIEVYDPEMPQVQLLNVATGDIKTVCVSALSDYQSRNVSITADGSLLAAACSSGLTIWDMKAAAVRTVVTNQPVTGVAFSPAGDRLAYVVNNTLIVKNLTANSEEQVFHNAPVTSLAFTPDSTMLLVGRANGLVELRDRTTGESQVSLREADGNPIYAIAISPDGSMVAAGHMMAKRAVIEVWNVENRQRIASQEIMLLKDTPPAFAFSAYSPSLMLSCTDFVEEKKTVISIWNVEKESTSQLLLDPLDDCQGQLLLLRPDDVQLVSASGTTVRVWDMIAALISAQMPVNQQEAITVLARNPAAAQLAIGAYVPMLGGGASSLYLWDMQPDSQPIMLLDATQDYQMVNSLAFAPNAGLLAVGGGNEYLETNSDIQLWNAKTQTTAATLSGHHGSVAALAFSPDGTLLASGSADGTIRLWGIP